MNKSDTLRGILGRAPVIPVIVVHELSQAVPLAEALCEGGLTVLEVTLRTPVALDAISAMRRAVPDAVVGAGTLTRPAHFRQAGDAGAQFGVSPGLTPALAAAATGVDWPYLPGVMTPGELLQAGELGFTLLKLFPAQQAGGVGMLKAMGSVFPDAAFCPTGGISRDNAGGFLALPNVMCVGGSWVAPPAMMASGDWSGIRALAQDASRLAGRA
ncbi:MAG TPA: bifunctional 4-hydroxy-2-oxoglutarate aldolase/2-dehydro-3-deoxy-phosphogluconate aldolase [Steroidobacteraceae bacterium]|nr:bifunctional 4-hydroxy-2-oxoglutarate aldolase/2-dehydro-3-deoxy-phosphogluconate aldolase [Steroidobacteraceae bacterium]